MKCYICSKKNARKQQKGRAICDRCFCTLLEKRIRKNARLNKFFSKGDRILVIGGINKYLVNSIITDLPVRLWFKPKEDKEFIKRNKINKLLVEQSMDDSINHFLNGFLSGNIKKEHAQNRISLLEVADDQELALFAKLNHLEFTPNKKDKAVQSLIEAVNQKHQGAKFGLFNSMRELNKLIC